MRYFLLKRSNNKDTRSMSMRLTPVFDSCIPTTRPVFSYYVVTNTKFLVSSQRLEFLEDVFFLVRSCVDCA